MKKFIVMLVIATVLSFLISLNYVNAQNLKESSYMPVVEKEDFSTTMNNLIAEKPTYMKRQKDLLAERYDLSNKISPDVTMSRGKHIQVGVRVKLPRG